MSDKGKIIFLKGPTASGKTALAVELVQHLPLEIISVDSALVYKGMDVGTSKPDVATLAKAPHRLIDICDPAEAYSAAQFREDTLREIADIHAHGKIPLLVGGTMLYFKALSEGLSNLPSADSVVRQRLEEDLAEQGLEKLHQRLAQVDPESGSRIHPNDPQRILRALEVYEITGRPMSKLWAEQQGAQLPFDVINLGLLPSDRAVLHQRIEERFRQMLEEGFIEEVEALRRRGDIHPELPSMRSVGYRQVWQYLDGDYDYETMIYRGVVATRQLAKRQITWMRSDETLQLFDPLDKNIFSMLLKFLSNASI